MMSGDCQSQGLAEWLQVLGCPEGVKPSAADLRKLNTPKMRSVWKHLQAHVMPTHVASTIRKNVLLARLKKENISVGQFKNFKLDSVNQLDKVKEIVKIEEEKDRIKKEIMKIDEKLQIEKSRLLQNIVTEERERNKLSEIEIKTSLLEQKHAKLLKDCKKVKVDNEMAVHLKSSKTPISHSEQNYQKSLVYKYVKNYRYPFKDTDDDSEYLCEMMCSILEFKPDTVLDGITKSAKEAITSLISQVDIPASMGDGVPSSKKVTFQKKLKDLRILLIRKELEINEYREKISLESIELEKEQEELVEAFTQKGVDYTKLEQVSPSNGLEKGDTENHCEETVEEKDTYACSKKNVSQLLKVVLEKIKEERRANKIQEQIRLMSNDECESLDDLKLSVSSFIEKEDELWKEVEKKVSEVNTVTTVLYSTLGDSGELNELLAEISQLADDFITETSQICKKNIKSSEFTDTILKEIEVFQGTPMVALQRKWDTSNEMLRECSAEKFMNNPSLLQFLQESEEKNAIINVLGKYIWSLSINPQFH